MKGVKKRLVSVTTDYRLPREFRKIINVKPHSEVKLKILKKVKEDGFKDELQKLV